MKFLFVHQNFPGQYVHLARHLGQEKHEVVFITQRAQGELRGIRKVVYQPARPVAASTHHYLRDAEAGVLNAQAVARVALELKASGFVPDVMFAHNGWGELWYLKDVFPATPLVGYLEFFYHAQGADVGFEPDARVTFDARPRLRMKNVGNLLALQAIDLGQTPTWWQRSLYPSEYRSRVHVVHEGIDTSRVRPNHEASVPLPGTDSRLTGADEVVTYVARNLEPYRGFHKFMQSLPAILDARPRAQVVVVGGDATSYGPRPAAGLAFREQALEALGGRIDLSRVHFMGKVPYATYLAILQVSKAHVYLTYPFVLSWSMLEAMAAGCVVVGSATPPVQEVLRDGDNGWLVDFHDPDAIGSRVIDVLARADEQAPIRLAARRTIVEHYDLQTVCLPAQLQLVRTALHQRT